MTPNDSEILNQVLDDFDQVFDPEVSLLWQARGKVHDHKMSLAYAMALFKRGRDADIERASRIVKQALTTQNTVENSHRYGNFKWVYEDKSVTDINAVQFCLWSLIELHRNFSELLDSEIVEAVRQAVAIGLFEVLELDVPWHYTNIFLIQTGNQILGAELLGREHRHHGEHGYRRLQEWIDHSNRNGAVYEYNSPGYCTVDIDSLARIAMYCQRKDMAIKARIMEERIWIHVAVRFHPGTLKLAGPYARAYHPATCGVPLGIYDHFYLATGNEDILRPSPYGDPESYHARAYRGFRAFKYEYNLPDYVKRLLTDQPLPYTIREQADKAVGNDITTHLTEEYSLGTNAKTYQETEQAQPGLWTPLCKSLVLHYRRPKPYHFGVLYSLYVVNGKRIADYYHKIHAAPDGVATADRYQDERALVRTVQDKNRAIVLYHPPQLKEDVFSLRTEVIVLGRKGIDCIMIDDAEITSLPAIFDRTNILFLKENGTYIAVLPLEPTNLNEEEAPTIELTEDKHRNLVYSIYNYQGPAKPFWEYKTPLPYFKANAKAGFILEVGSIREFDSFNEFREHIRQAKISDVTTSDHRRQVSYQSGNDTIALTVDLKNNALIDRHINGAVYRAPDLTADTIKQDTSGKIELAGARLLTDPRPAWLLIDETLGTYVAATPSPQGGPLRLETPSSSLECADFGFGRIAYYPGDNPRLDLLATDLGSPIYFSRQGEIAPAVHLNGKNVSSKITTMEKDGETVYCIPAGKT